MIVYKYVTPDRIDVLEKGRIRLTQADALNDPFEINPCFSAYNKGAIEFAKARLTGQGYTHSQLPTDAEIAELARQQSQRFREQLYPEFLMLSLSKTNKNLLMWSHYASCHRGLVFAFDSKHPFFQGRLPLRTELLAVEYSQNRFVLSKLEHWKTSEDVMPAFLRKSIDWAYEQELRVFARAREATEQKKDPQVLPIYLFDFPKECLTEIVFGIFTNEAVKNRAIEVVKVRYPQVRLFQAGLNESSFDLDIKPLTFQISD
jgi:hypothetical protein